MPMEYNVSILDQASELGGININTTHIIKLLFRNKYPNTIPLSEREYELFLFKKLLTLIIDTLRNDLLADVLSQYIAPENMLPLEEQIYSKYFFDYLIYALSADGVIESGLDEGVSVAFMLASTREGRELLSRNDFFVRNKIGPNALNAVIKNGPFAGDSVAFILARNNITLLQADGNRLARLINKNSFNAVIQYGSNAGYSFASLLFYSARSNLNSILFMGDVSRLSSLVNDDTLNAVDEQGFSVAYWLARDDLRGILNANKYALIKAIRAETLNTIIKDDIYNNGASVALWLLVSFHNTCLDLLFSIDLGFIGDAINADALNSVFVHDILHISIAHYLASFPKGIEILCRNNYALGRLINATNLYYNTQNLTIAELLNNTPAGNITPQGKQLFSIITSFAAADTPEEVDILPNISETPQASNSTFFKRNLSDEYGGDENSTQAVKKQNTLP